MVAAGQFREDLYYRIHVLTVALPPLRERREDIPLLIEHFLARHRHPASRPRRLSPGCAAQMHDYPWPGNVRELENEVERLVVLAGDASTIDIELLSPRIRQWTPPEQSLAPEVIDSGSLPAAVEALERRMIGAAMRRHGGNKTRAAEDLKVSRRNLIRLVQKYQLE
jgi:transcriptional regulator with PAS, ATPase and Fis domain